MPAKPQSELVQELQEQVANLKLTLAVQDSLISSSNLIRLVERMAIAEERITQNNNIKLETDRLAKQFILVEERVAEMQKFKDEARKQLWTFAFMAIGSVLTLLVNLAFTAFK